MSVEKKIRFEVKLAILVYPKLAKPSFLRRMKFQEQYYNETFNTKEKQIMWKDVKNEL